MKTNKVKPIEIHVGLTGGVRLVDVDGFFAQEKVQKQLEKMEKMDIVGKKLDDKTLFPKKPSKHSIMTAFSKEAQKMDKEISALNNYFKEHIKVTDRMLESMTPVRELQQRVQDSLKPFSTIIEECKKEVEKYDEIRKLTQASLEPLADAYKKELSKYNEIYQSLQPSLNQISEITEAVNRTIGLGINDIREAVKRLPEHTRKTLVLMAERGWYMDYNMAVFDLKNLGETLLNGEEKEVEDALIKYFEEQTDEIEKTIVKQFPHRADIINSAFRTHRNEDYNSSIPLFLAQTDGIWKDVFGYSFFAKKDKKPRTAEYVAEFNQLAGETMSADLLSPLAEITPILESEDMHDNNSTGFNRHAILHGNSLDYGTKLNSLRSISLIGYVSHIAECKKRKTTTH